MQRNSFIAACTSALMILSGAAFAQDSSSSGQSGMGGSTSSGQQGQAGGKAQGGAGAAVPSGHMRTVTVTVKSTDPANHKVDFEAQVTPEASIIENGQPIRLDQLKPGDQVRASFDPATNNVVKLQVTRAGAGSESGTMGGTGEAGGGSSKQPSGGSSSSSGAGSSTGGGSSSSGSY